MSAPCLLLDDEITLVKVNKDAYSGDSINSQAVVGASIDLNTGYSHNTYQDAAVSDAVAYISPSSQFVKNNYNRLEEMLVVIDLFGTPNDRAWYKVTRVNVARDTQLGNQIDHLELLLKKTAALGA